MIPPPTGGVEELEESVETTEFSLPPEFPGLERFKAGDSVQLTVLRVDEDGTVSVGPAQEPEQSFEDDMRENVTETGY